MPAPSCILRVAIKTPLRLCFDYLPEHKGDIKKLKPGQRLLVPFGKREQRTGLLVDISNSSDLKPEKLKKISGVIDQCPLFDKKHLKFLLWANQYYHYPVGEVILGTLPALLRKGFPAAIKHEMQLHMTRSDKHCHSILLKNAPKQTAIVNFIKQYPEGVTHAFLRKNFVNCSSQLKSLIDKGIIESYYKSQKPLQYNDIPKKIRLNTAQKHAVDSIVKAKDHYQAFLLNGITGSGKTEVYFKCIEKIITSGKQALILLPEIGLTPQFIDRFKQHFNLSVAVMHSALTDRERLNAWLQARDNEVRVILGTRSAIWIPLKNPGIIIIDEEHDLSYKQQDGFRYSARDMALIRGQQENIPVVLGTATPSLETLKNVTTGRYHELKLLKRTGNANLPDINILDVRGKKMIGAFSRPLLDSIKECLYRKEQVLLFHNRRGYAPTMMCHDCGDILLCSRCDIQLTYHKYKNKLCCHVCGHEKKLIESCPGCSGKQLIEVGFGTERITETLSKHFPQSSILRIDSDTTRRKGTMNNIVKSINTGSADILVGTQILAKGHHFPRITLVGIVDVDRGLFSADYRASERMAQIITQVSGRAGREEHHGLVIIQTHYPDHPLLTTLIREGYNNFAKLVLHERSEARLPPYSYQALLRAEANNIDDVDEFLTEAKSYFSKLNHHKVELFGPIDSIISKRAGRYRLQLLIQANHRKTLREALKPWIIYIEKLTSARKVRWSLDIDPQDIH